MQEWGKQATAKMTGIPMSIGVQLLARGDVTARGVLAPEAAFEPTQFIAELARRGIYVEEHIEEEGIVDSRPADLLEKMPHTTSLAEVLADSQSD
jgi:saccharopine dehydrogenase-like NADP-dependent oxidoreductase